ncbi:MAG TPA: C40 family peptidase [Candidatus Baltobacteraceae bacterium]
MTTAVLAFLLAGSSAFALADPAASAPQTAAVTTTTASVPATTASSEAAAEPGVPVDSPDVAQWTAQLIREQHAAPAHHAAHGLGKFASRILARTTTIARTLTRDALRFLGTPYVFGGTSTSGFDCSGYVQHVFAMLGVSIPRTADAQYYAGHHISGGMKPGDLVFFQTYEPGPSHVGIYLGNGKFVHASSHGVMVSSLSDSYWANRYLGAKRMIASIK